MDSADPAARPDTRADGSHQPQQIRDQGNRLRPLFRFTQLEYPWPLGPPDGRYLLRRQDDPERDDPSYVLVVATLGAPQRRWLARRRKRSNARPEPEPTPVPTSRATVIEVEAPFEDAEAASRWLRGAGEADLEAGIDVLNGALHAFRLVTADPHVFEVGRGQALAARIGYGDGEQVADGLWSDARELLKGAKREPRAKVLQPQARLAAVLSGRERALVCEELVLRARLDLDQNRDREAALQVLVGLDAALAELQTDPAAASLGERLEELRGHREAIARAAQAALAGPLPASERKAVEHTLQRIEAALRARAVVNA